MNTARVVTETDLTQGLFALIKNNVQTIDSSTNTHKKTRQLYQETIQEIKKIEKIISENNFYRFQNGADFYKKLLPDLKLRADHLRMSLFGYPSYVDISFLSWTKKSNQLPVFMVLDLEDANGFSITVEANSMWGTGFQTSFHPKKLPEQIKSQYQGTVQRIQNLIYENCLWNASLQANYSGLMPDDARIVIDKAYKSDLFERIFVIAETPKDLKINQGALALGDPLVIGWTGFDFYLITVYDPTDLERCIIEEYIFPSIPR